MRSHSSFACVLKPGLGLALALLILDVQAYPEFQQFIVKNSGRPVNCAFCHAHADGPEGTAPGQIGHLKPAEQNELLRARAAFAPGQNVTNPILNSFGNHIINGIGKKKFVELRVAPAQLAAVLPQASDLDQDGIPDVREYLEGTHPGMRSDGNPRLLFLNNLKRNLPQIFLTLGATVLGIWALGHLLHGFAAASRLREEE